MYKIKCGSCLTKKNYPGKVDLILFDPPFYSVKANYKQIRDDTENKLDEIKNFENYHAAFKRICEISNKILRDHGWFIFKADDITAREMYPVVGNFFEYENRSIIWNKGRIGVGRKIRPQHELLEVYHHYKEKQFWGGPKPEKKQITYNDLFGKKTKVKIKKWR